MDRFLNLRDTEIPSHRTLRDGLFAGAVPGTSCQATFAPSGTKNHPEQPLLGAILVRRLHTFRAEALIKLAPIRVNPGVNGAKIRNRMILFRKGYRSQS
jgi:hypothetical protein